MQVTTVETTTRQCSVFIVPLLFLKNLTNQTTRDRANSAADFTFERVIHPISTADFFRDYYEKKPCIIARNDAGYYHELLTLNDVNDILGSQTLRFPKVKVVNSALEEQPRPETFTTNGTEIHPARFLKHYSQGSTLVFSSLHEHLKTLGVFCDRMANYLSHGFQTNIYLTPPNAQGFNPHYDTHDVFILQVAGSKKWRLFDTPIELPLKSQPFEIKRVAPGPVSMEFVLNSGDMLYIPRGLMHDAETTGELSMHITAGLLGYTWQDMLVEAVLHHGATDIEFRKNLPVGFSREDAPGTEVLKRHISSLLERMLGSMDVSAGLGRFTDKLQSDIRPNLPQQFNAILHLSEVRADTPIAMRSEHHFHISESDEKCGIHVFGSIIEFPAFMLPALHHVRSHHSFIVSDLPDCVDEQGKVTFVKRLVKEGLAVPETHLT